MTAKELAASLNGREYRSEMTLEEMSIANKSGLVVVFGASDDLMEFRGAIDDEVSCYDGGTAYVYEQGLYNAPDNCEECNRCEHVIFARDACATVSAIWCKGDYAWAYRTEIPHETFEILEDGEKYCQGIVFSMDDLKPNDKYSSEDKERYFNVLRGVAISSHLPMQEKQTLTEFISYLESEVYVHER